MTIYEKIHKYILAHDLLKPGEKVLVGVSGGGDSLCLLDSLIALDFRPIVAHFDHQLRKNSDRDCEMVREIAHRYRVEFVTESGNPMVLAARGVSIEEASRILRYGYFLRIAIKLGVKVIAVAHTLDDQVETILMNFIRGSGPDGLRGMVAKQSMSQWGDRDEDRHIRLIRPMLEITKEEAKRHCKELGLNPIHDPTNEDDRYLRNRVRHQLIPYLETYNPNIVSTILRMSNVMQKEVAYLDQQLRDCVADLHVERMAERITFRRKSFSSLHPSIQRRFVRELLAQVNVDYSRMNLDAVDRAIAFVSQLQAWADLDWFSNWRITLSPEHVYIHQIGDESMFDQFPKLNREPIELSGNEGNILLGRNWMIETKSRELSRELKREMSENDDESIAFLDESNFDQGVILRKPRRGDRFQPLGMKGSTKLSDFFINLKIPKQARPYWPVLDINGQIGWVVGLRLSETARVTDTSRRVVTLRLMPNKE